MSPRTWRPGLLGVLAMVVLAACGPAGGGGQAPPETIRLYTSVTQDTVDAVVDRFRRRHPDVRVELFRAPTGELNARLAAEQREGRIRADVLWVTDPLSMQQYEASGWLRNWTPENADVVPAEFREDSFLGTRILNLVLVHRQGLTPPPASWRDLTKPAYANGVAIPDPGFAGSAFAALGYFALTEQFGFDYYRALDANGVTQVSSPVDIVSGVAEGRFDAGMSLDKVAFSAQDKGSPIEVVFPEPGAIALYSPIGVTTTSEQPRAAQTFAAFTLTREAQTAIAETGWQPVRDDVPWEREGPTVTVDWAKAFDRQDELLSTYRSIVGE